jgi:hypothetical protein
MGAQFLRRSSPHFRLLVVFGAYLLITGLITWPALGRLGTEIPDRLGDGYVHLWTFNWLKEALSTGTNPFFTSRLFFPIGATLANHNIAWVHFFIWLPVQAVTGEAAAFSLVFLFNYTLNAFATFLLVRRLTQSDAAAFIGGLVAGFWPYNISHQGHPNLIAIWWIPLILMALEDLFARRQFRYALLAGALVGLLGITRWQLLVIGSILLGMACIYHLAQCPTRYWRQVFLLLVVSGLVAAGLMAPFLFPVLQYQAIRGNPEELLLSDEVAYGSDLLAYLLPSRYHPLWGRSIMGAVARLAGNAIYVRSIGFVPFGLALVGAFAQWRKAAFWTISALIYLVLSLGSPLYVLGQPLWTMPYALLEDNFVFQLVRFPDRFNVILAIPVAVLVGLGVAWLQSRFSAQRGRAIAVLCSALILFEYMVAYPMLPLTVPPWHADLAETDRPFGLLDIPMCPQAIFNKRYMFYQLQHTKPLVQGHVSRPSSEMFAFIDTVPLLKEANCQFYAPAAVKNVSEQLRLLAASGIPYLVLHKEYLELDQLDSWRKWLVIPPRFEDSLQVVYDTAAHSHGLIEWSHPMLTDESGTTSLGLVDSGKASVPPELVQGNWLVTEVTWQATKRPIDALRACVDLIDTGGQSAQKECHPLSDDWATTQWQEGEIVHADYPIQLDPFLPPGKYEVLLSLRHEASDEPISQQAVVGNVTVKALARKFIPPVDPVTEIASWQDQMTLVGYELIEEAGTLQVALHWRAETRMPTSYKFFLHVTDRSSGELVFQEDRIPGDWEYPTDWWSAGEYVTELITLPFSGPLPDQYDIGIGWYDPDTSERLPVTTTLPDQLIEENKLLLAR